MTNQLEKYIAEGNEITSDKFIDRWIVKVTEFLLGSGRHDDAAYFRSVGENHSDRFTELAAKIGKLDSIYAEESEESRVTQNIYKRNATASNNKVFLVHGHDSEAKEIACRFVEKLGLEAVVLHEQANEGHTVIEKFEKHSDVAFAMILLTPDDMGESVENKDTLRFRARQNVVLELGYFMGALGRKHVCALHKGNIEIPSDFQGVLYIPMDDAGAWKNKVAQELIECGLKIELTGLLN